MSVFNEAAQWIALAIILVMVLGLYRHLSIVLGFADQSVAAQAGPGVGKKLPKELAAGLTSHADIEKIAFISESCQSCQRLLADLDSSLGAHGRVALAYHEDATPEFQAALRDVEHAFPIELTADLWNQCNVLTTPIVCSIDRDGRVNDKQVTHLLGSLAHAQ